MMAGNAIASGFNGYLVSVGLIMALMLPLAFGLVVLGERRQRLTDEKVRRLNDELSEAIAAADREAVVRDSQVQRQRFESRLANALDMAEGEPEVIDVIERSFGAVLPDAPVELLLADNSHAHLVRMAAVGPDGEPPSCGVDSQTAARRRGGRRSRRSTTATFWTPVRSCATGRRGASRRCACLSRSWVGPLA